MIKPLDFFRASVDLHLFTTFSGSARVGETLMRVEEAARRVQLSASTLNKLRIRGGGPRYRKLGHAVRYAPSDIADWLGSNARSSTSDQA